MSDSLFDTEITKAAVLVKELQLSLSNIEQQLRVAREKEKAFKKLQSLRVCAFNMHKREMLENLIRGI